jgi:hypothetical protein
VVFELGGAIAKVRSAGRLSRADVATRLFLFLEKKPMQRRALITGVTGQDGAYLAELLIAKDYEVMSRSCSCITVIWPTATA